MRVDAVVIGRNEGARLEACLTSLIPQVARVVYVDSGSEDGSVALATALGVEVVVLDIAQPFTAARARNAGVAALGPGAGCVQFVDGDCVVARDWVATGLAALQEDADLALVCGRRRELHPETSVYNRLCDIEWDTPTGEATACGGDALVRRAAFDEVGGFDAALIAGEEPDLCLRLRRAGWRIWRLDAEMTGHDAAMTTFGQWWRRTRRAGHAYAEAASGHRAGPERHWVAETWRALIWGLVLPLAMLLALLISGWAALLWLIYPAQVVRLWRRQGSLEWAVFNVLGKFAEAQGVLGYWLGRITGRGARLIEYK